MIYKLLNQYNFEKDIKESIIYARTKSSLSIIIQDKEISYDI